MSKLTDTIAAKLDQRIIENFADIYLVEEELKRIENKHDLDDPAVIAAIATCADVASAQHRLIARPPESLAKGLNAALERGGLRATAEVLARALLDGALLESAAPETAKSKLPAFAHPSRLPAPMRGGKKADAAEVSELVQAIAKAKLGEPPETEFTAESLARLGRALALGWLSHGSEPKHKWGAFAAAHFPDDATARDLGMMARELGPRVGQFSKAQILVDVLEAMNTRAALEALHELATKVKTRSVRDRAKAAFDAAAKRSGTTQADLADKLIADDKPIGKDFLKRLEQRMVTGAAMPALEFFENILQRPAVREAARGVVFSAGKKTFTIGVEDELVDASGKAFTLAKGAEVVVVHPIDLAGKDAAKWRARITKAPFAQLDRNVRKFASPNAVAKHAKQLTRGRELSQGALYGLENLGWKRGGIVGGTFSRLERELDGVTVAIEFEPGVYAGRGMARPQSITSVTARGKGSPRALGEIARELESLGR